MKIHDRCALSISQPYSDGNREHVNGYEWGGSSWGQNDRGARGKEKWLLTFNQESSASPFLLDADMPACGG